MSDQGQSVVGQPMDRVDGRAKVTGQARYAAEFPIDAVAHAVLVGSNIAHGAIRSIDSTPAEKAPGVIAVITYRNAPKLEPVAGGQGDKPPTPEEIAAARRKLPLQGPDIRHAGEYVAVVVAETLEQARHAGELLQIAYAEKVPAIGLARERARALPPKGKIAGKPADVVRGDPATALAGAALKVQQTYRTPTQHHNPMEPHATLAAWNGDRLLVYDSTQYSYGVRHVLATLFGIPEDSVRVVCKYVGGAFGAKGTVWNHVALAAAAARVAKRPVKLVVTRAQMFANTGHRSETEQHITLAAQHDGRILAITHEGLSHTSTFDEFVEPFSKATHMMYASPALHASQRVVALNVGTPTYMRAPGETSGMFALECALDELAEAAGIDPIELRSRNYASSDPDTGLPWSTNALAECYRIGAERFGWTRRLAHTGATRDGHELVGFGMASAVYPVNHFPSSARVRIRRDGTALAESSTHELGTGTYTVLTQIAADALHLTPDRVRVEIGDTDLPKAFVSGGSSTVMTVGSSIHGAATAAVAKLIELARADARSPLHGAPADAIVGEIGSLRLKDDPARSETYAAILARAGMDEIEATHDTKFDDTHKTHSSHAFGAHFAEVRVDPDLGMARVSRFTGVFGVGKVMNRKTAASQLRGGIVMGIGMALMEATLYDPRSGRVLNADLAEYHVPVCADMPDIDVQMVDEIDTHASPIGAKGVGEIGIVGAAAAVANAIYNACGIRVRDLPITPDKLLGTTRTA